MGEVGSDGGKWVYGTRGIHGEMAFGLSVVESSGGKYAFTALYCTRSRRGQRAVVQRGHGWQHSRGVFGRAYLGGRGKWHIGYP